MKPLRILVIKMSSLGDVVHALPAITDLKETFANCEIDWVVESSFAEIPAWHPAVNTIIPIQLRYWRKHLGKLSTYQAIWQFIRTLRSKQYDFVIDAQGLLKSALVTGLTRANQKVGFNHKSAKEPIATWFYQRKIDIPWGHHAIDRVRQLFASTFGYTLKEQINYGLQDLTSNLEIKIDPNITTDSNTSIPPKLLANSVFLLHGTTWDTKHYPEASWLEVSKALIASGYHCVLSYGNAAEEQRARRLHALNPSIQILPKMSLSELAKWMRQSIGAISVDTGLAHIAAALHLPTLSLYGPTNPVWTGTRGLYQQHLHGKISCSPCLRKHCLYQDKSQGNKLHFTLPCFEALPPRLVVQSFKDLLSRIENE